MDSEGKRSGFCFFSAHLAGLMGKLCLVQRIVIRMGNVQCGYVELDSIPSANELFNCASYLEIVSTTVKSYSNILSHFRHKWSVKIAPGFIPRALVDPPVRRRERVGACKDPSQVCGHNAGEVTRVCLCVAASLTGTLGP